MPEGDTIRRLADRISHTLGGQHVHRSAMRDPRLAGVVLEGRVLVGADAYGKHLFVRFDDGRSLHAHLMMSGSFEVGRASTQPEWRRRVELWLDRGRLTAVDVPQLAMIDTREEGTVTAQLGPDLCAPAAAPDAAEITARLLSDPTIPLTGAMLDQRNAAGWGNLYVNDLPFLAGVSPFRPVGAIGDLESLVKLGIAMIRFNADHGPQNTTGRRLHADARWVHAAGRRPCPVCATRLDYMNAERSPWRRSITWCPSCQAPEHAAVDHVRIRRLIALHPAVRVL